MTKRGEYPNFDSSKRKKANAAGFGKDATFLRRKQPTQPLILIKTTKQPADPYFHPIF